MEGSSGASCNDILEEYLDFHAPILRASPEVKERGGVLVKNANQAMEEILVGVLGKQTLLNRLYQEHIVISDKIIEFYLLWGNRRNFVSANIEYLRRLPEIYEQMKVLSRIAREYKDKLRRGQGIFDDFKTHVQNHMKSMEQCLDVIFQAQNWSDLEQVEIPNLEWIERVPDPELHILSDKWEEMQLGVEISDCLRMLQMLLLQPEPEIEDELENM